MWGGGVSSPPGRGLGRGLLWMPYYVSKVARMMAVISCHLIISRMLGLNCRFILLFSIAIAFSAIISHGTVPTDLVTSTILPIPKVKCVSSVSSDNFRAIMLYVIIL